MVKIIISYEIGGVVRDLMTDVVNKDNVETLNSLSKLNFRIVFIPQLK